MKIAERSDWENIKPMSDNYARLSVHIKLNLEEFENLKLGRIPKQMEDKWFIFIENELIYFHRSWTGFCVFIAKIERKSENEFEINEVLVERNPEFYDSNNDATDIGLLKTLISFIIQKPKEEIKNEAEMYLALLNKNKKPWWKFW